MTLGERIKRLIEEKNTTKLELQKFVGVHISTINEWIRNDKVPYHSNIKKIAMFFGIELTDLLDGVDYKRRISSNKNRKKQYINNTPTLCWKCANAVPKLRNGKYVTGCSWSLQKTPVVGWNAKKKP